MEMIIQRNDRLDQIHKDINLLQHLNEVNVSVFKPTTNFAQFKDDNASSILSGTSTHTDSYLYASSIQSSTNFHRIVRNQSFYERALNDMMNGVLQISWEDELKKDPPKPLCLTQSTCDLSDAEKEQIAKYHQKMFNLRNDRVQYISKLYEEKSTLESLIDHQVRSLNKCIENIIKTKVKAQFAICSEQLKILISARDHMRLKNLTEKERTILLVMILLIISVSLMKLCFQLFSLMDSFPVVKENN